MRIKLQWITLQTFFKEKDILMNNRNIFLFDLRHPILLHLQK